MKKTVALMMAAIMLMAFAGCTGGADKPDAQGMITTLPAEGGKPVVTETEAPAETPAAAETKAGITRGKWENGTYRNEMAGFCFTPPESWQVLDDEHIAELMGISKELLDTEGYDLNDKDVVYDTVTFDPNSGTNVAIAYEKLDIFGALGTNTQSIMDEVVKQMSANTALQYSFNYVATTEQNIGGADYLCAEFDVGADTGTRKQYILLNKLDSYICNITITAMASEPIEEFLPMFTSAQTAMADCCG